MNFVFDFGAVLFTWKPADLMAQCFPQRAGTAETAAALAHAMFAHGDWNGFDQGVLEMDALDFVNDKANAHTLDVLQVDLYDATARGPVLDTPEFYTSCNACLRDDGIMTVNLFGDHPSYARNLKAIKFAFAQVICLPQVHDGNVVAIAFKRQRDIDPAALAARAAQIVADTKLPAKSWVKGILTK